jgi:toxin ParE1/3/4
MPLELRTSKQAKADLVEIWQYIAADNPLAADKLLRGIGAAFAQAADYPDIGRRLPEIGPHVHAIVFRRYMIIYTVDEPAQTVELTRVFHGARRWQDMLS